MKYYLLVLFFSLAFGLPAPAIQNNKNYYVSLKMKNSRSERPDDLRCTFLKLNLNYTQNIVGFYPKTSKYLAHHMLVFTCKELPNLENKHLNGESWYCGPGGELGVCKQEPEGFSENIIYAWALNADELRLPEQAGLRVGPGTDNNYLVLQMHYKEQFQKGYTDNSGVEIEINPENLKYQVGLFILGSFGFIPPKLKEFRMESACSFDQNFEMIPFAYRTHSHSLGRVTSGYLIRNNKWIELGRMSPQQPQMFYPVTNTNIRIIKNDMLASRCTMNSLSRENITHIGARNEDEMCNFYIMFYTSYKGKMDNFACFSDAQKFKWSLNLLSTSEPPENASNLDGVDLKVEMQMDF